MNEFQTIQFAYMEFLKFLNDSRNKRFEWISFAPRQESTMEKLEKGRNRNMPYIDPHRRKRDDRSIGYGYWIRRLHYFRKIRAHKSERGYETKIPDGETSVLELCRM